MHFVVDGEMENQQIWQADYNPELQRQRNKYFFEFWFLNQGKYYVNHSSSHIFLITLKNKK